MFRSFLTCCHYYKYIAIVCIWMHWFFAFCLLTYQEEGHPFPSLSVAYGKLKLMDSCSLPSTQRGSSVPPRRGPLALHGIGVGELPPPPPIGVSHIALCAMFVCWCLWSEWCHPTTVWGSAVPSGDSSSYFGTIHRSSRSLFPAEPWRMRHHTHCKPGGARYLWKFLSNSGL